MRFFLLLLVAISFNPCLSAAQNITDEPEAREIFEEVDRRRDLVTYETADMAMVIYGSRGSTRDRDIRSFSYNEGDVSKSLLIFMEPANVRGTAFLSVSRGSEEEQKLYLPALNRIQIISAVEKSDRFMGSDFTYEDLGDRNPEDYSFELAEKTDTSYVLRAEKKSDSQYDYIRFYVHPERYFLQKAEYFKEGKMIKRLEAGSHEQVLEEVWRPGVMTMYDLQNDRRTTLRWSNRAINEPIPDWRFTERGLRRGL